MNWHTCVSRELTILWLMRHKTPPGQNSHHENAMYWTEEDGFIEPDDKQSCYWKNSPALLFCIFIVGKQGLIQLLFPPYCLIKSGEGRISIPVFSPFLPSVVFLCKSKHRVTVPGSSATPPMPSSSVHPQSNWSPGKPPPENRKSLGKFACPWSHSWLTFSTLSPTGSLEKFLQKEKITSANLLIVKSQSSY